MNVLDRDRAPSRVFTHSPQTAKRCCEGVFTLYVELRLGHGQQVNAINKAVEERSSSALNPEDWI